MYPNRPHGPGTGFYVPPEEDQMSTHTIPPVTATGGQDDAERRQRVLRALRERRRRAVVGTIAQRCSAQIVTRRWE